jgi:GT2 family glycosyltransferase
MTGFSADAPDGRGFPKVSVVIPNHNGAAWLPQCLESLARQEYRDFEVILVDDASTDESVNLVRGRFPDVRRILLPNNTGFAAAVNQGIAGARGTYVVLLNNDTVAEPGWLTALVRLADTRPREVGAIASKMLRMEDPHRIDDAGDALSWTGAAEKLGHQQPAGDFLEEREVFSVCAGAALYRRSFLKEMGGFDERFFAYLEDVDLGLRGRLAGYRYLFEPGARVLHQGQGSGMSRSQYVRLMTRNRLLLFLKNVPLSLLVKRLPQILRGQIHFLIAYRQPWQSLVGYASLVGCIPHILRERDRMKSSRRIPTSQLDAMLVHGNGTPPS